MRSIHKHEAIGIFASIAAMALVLVALKYNANPLQTVSRIDPQTQQGGVVVAGEDSEGEGSGLADALVEAAAGGGVLERLVVDDVRVGTGRAVAEGDTVTVHYIGSTQDGVQFDNSYVREEPFVFTVGDGKVIDGWEEGLVGMQIGGQRILVIPPSLGYGNRQIGPIPAGSNLVFAIELLAIE